MSKFCSSLVLILLMCFFPPILLAQESCKEGKGSSEKETPSCNDFGDHFGDTIKHGVDAAEKMVHGKDHSGDGNDGKSAGDSAKEAYNSAVKAGKSASDCVEKVITVTVDKVRSTEHRSQRRYTRSTSGRPDFRTKNN